MATYLYCVQNILFKFDQYNLPQQMKAVFRAFHEVKTSQLDEIAFRRQIRLSPTKRAAIVATMVKCAEIMENKPEEAGNCTSMIKSCGEMLELADKKVEDGGFPSFTELPAEIRNRIYDMYLGNGDDDDKPIVPYSKLGDCYCADHQAPQWKRPGPIDMELAFTSKQMGREVLSSFYSKRKIYFSCACEMHHVLTNNALLKSTINHIMFHWCGERADKGIFQLQTMPQLEQMTVVISRSTCRYVSNEEEEIRRFFAPKPGAVTTIPQCLGWEELIGIRGLTWVTVDHAKKRTADLCTDEERRSLENMLFAHVVESYVDSSDEDN